MSNAAETNKDAPVVAEFFCFRIRQNPVNPLRLYAGTLHSLVDTAFESRFRDAGFRRWRRAAAHSFSHIFRPLSSKQGFRPVDSVAPFIDSGRVTVYCPDSIDLDSFYNKRIHPADRMRTHMAFENVIVHDVFDFARREGGAHRVGMCGASVGAYRAANIAFKHPDAISHLISMSGAFDISDFFGRLPRR
jgi:hypothetical protein